MALTITRTNCQKLIEAQLCGLPCGWKSAIASAICFAVTSSQGVSGYSGFSGFSGADGNAASGFSGIGFSGQSGFSGYSGFSGDNPGSSGFSGGSGYSGFSGANPGASGYSGYSGANPGVSGYSGYSGYSGDNPGSSGYSGFSGAGGASGFSGTATLVTADNGLIMSTPTNVQLGSPSPTGAPLLHYTYIDHTGGDYGIEHIGDAGNGVPLLRAGGGVQGAYFQGSTVGATGQSDSIPLWAVNTKTTTTVGTGIVINRQATTGGTGIGSSIQWNLQNSSNSVIKAGDTIIKYDNGTAGSETAQYYLALANLGAASSNIMTAHGSGVVGIGNFSSFNSTRLDVVDNALAGGLTKMVNFSSTSINAGLLLNVTGVGSMAGILATTVNQVAITAVADAATAISGTSTSGFGVSGNSTSSYAGTYTINPSSTNTVAPILLLARASSGTATDGIGGSIQFAVESALGSNNTSNEIKSRWTTAADLTRTSEFSITGVSSAAIQTLLTISGAGIFTLTQGLQNFADDTAAAVGGIPVNGLYRTASAVKIRVT